MWSCNPVLIQIDDMIRSLFYEMNRNTMFGYDDPFHRSWPCKRVSSILYITHRITASIRIKSPI